VKPEAPNTALPIYCSIAPLANPPRSRRLSEFGVALRHPARESSPFTTFVIRHSSFVIPIALLLISASLASANTPTHQSSVSVSSIDGIDCITADDIAAVSEEPVQVCDDPSDSPNAPDQGTSLSADKASIPSRPNQSPSHFADTGFCALAQSPPAITLVFLIPVHCFYSLHEHIRERAPPSLV
jgi:hypothetical protein